MPLFMINGKIIDIHKKEIYGAVILVGADGIIKNISKCDINDRMPFISPGFIDSHIHVESSLLTPLSLSEILVKHGTIGCVSDPHEIANVLGIDGVRWMIENSRKAKIRYCWGAPSCVPATPFETSGAVITAKDVYELLQTDDIGYLSEVMNYPDVLKRDQETIDKICAAWMTHKPIDGHAPCLSGPDLTKYFSYGISTDHEASTEEEAYEKILNGMNILIREGSAAKNFEALKGILKKFPDKCMLCTDDAHASDLVHGHINILVKRAIDSGIDVFDAFSAATLNPTKHYNLKNGLLRVGDPADFILISSLESMEVVRTYINGVVVYSKDREQTSYRPPVTDAPNKFIREKMVSLEDISIKTVADKKKVRVIGVIEDQLLTTENIADYPIIESDDIVKVVVVNRYSKDCDPAIGFTSGFGMADGAIASSISHDSHNVIAIGTNDDDIVRALNLVISNKGAVVAVCGDHESVLRLQVAGLMSSDGVEHVLKAEKEINSIIDLIGFKVSSPFTLLSFLSLLVIPALKISDKGLFNSGEFEFVDMFL